MQTFLRSGHLLTEDRRSRAKGLLSCKFTLPPWRNYDERKGNILYHFFQWVGFSFVRNYLLGCRVSFVTYTSQMLKWDNMIMNIEKRPKKSWASQKPTGGYFAEYRKGASSLMKKNL